MKKLFLILVFALASLAGANARDWTVSLGAGDGLPGENVQKGANTVQVYKSDVIKPTEALTTLRFTVAQNYNGERPNGNNFVTGLSELVVYAADGKTVIPYTATSNADHNTLSGGTDGAGLAALNDGNWNNYWHSCWSATGAQADFHHLELTFAYPVSEFILEWGARPGNVKNAPLLVGLTKGGVDYVPYADWAFTVGAEITSMDQLESARYFVMKSNVPVEYHTYVSNHESTEGAFGTQTTKEPNVGPGPQYVSGGNVAETAAPEYAVQLIPADGGYYIYYVTEGKFLSANPTDNFYNGANGGQGKTGKMSDAAIVTITEDGNGKFEMSYMMEYEGEEIEIHVGATPSSGGFKNVDKSRYNFYMEGYPFCLNYAYILAFDWTFEEVTMNYPAKYASIPVRNAIKEAKSIYTFMDSVAVEGYEDAYDEFMIVLGEAESNLANGTYTDVEKVFADVETLNAAMGAYVYSKIEWFYDEYQYELETYLEQCVPSTQPLDGYYTEEAYYQYIEVLITRASELYDEAYGNEYAYISDMKTFINRVQRNVDSFLASKIEYVTLPKVYTSENPHQTPLGTLVNNRYDWEQLVVLNEPVNGIRLTFLETTVGNAASNGKFHGFPMVALSGLEIKDGEGNLLALSSDLVTSNSEVGEGLEGAGNGPISALFDEDVDTYYHSDWGGGRYDQPYTYIYFDIKFPEGVSLTNFTLKTTGRQGHNQITLTPSEVCITKYGEEYDSYVFRENPYNVAGGTQITDASQLKDGGIYIISGNLRVKTQEAAPRFYAGTAPYHSNIKAALNDPCVYMFKKTAKGWNIISLANAQYWALNKTVNENTNEETGETTTSTNWSTGLTVYPSNAAEVNFVKSGNLENTFAIYSEIGDNMVDASWNWTNSNDSTGVINIEKGEVNANKFVFMDWDNSLAGRPCVSAIPGEFTYGLDAISAHAKYEEFKNGDGYSAGDYLHFNKANGEGEWNIYEVTMDDPYYLWATGIVASLDDLGIILGKDPGCIQGDIPVLDAAIESFKSIVANEDKARAQAAVEAYLENIDLLQSVERVKVQDGCYYAIESAYTEYYKQQGKIKAIYADANGLSWMDAPAAYNRENAQFVFRFMQYDGENDPDCLGVPEGEENNVFRIYSDYADEQNGSWGYGYFGTGGGTTQVAMADDFGAALYVVKPIQANIYTIYAVGSDPLHTAGHGSGAGTQGRIVNWTGGAGTPSSWYLKLVEDFDINDVPPVEKPLEIVAVTPSAPVDKLSTVTITFSDEIEGTFDMMAMSQIYLGSRSNGCSYVVKGNVLTITPFNAITTSGEYGLVIPEGLITRKSNGEKISLNKEIVFTVKAPFAALEITGYTPIEAVESLETITITFNDEIEGTFDMMAMNQIYLGSRRNGCSFAVEGNVLTITPFNAITTPGEYGLVIPEGLITRKANGEPITIDREIVFTVEEPVVIVNTMEIADATVNAGEQVTLSFNMKNDSEISCYQCDLYLPDGMSVATDNYGNKLINVSYERTTPSRHRCSYSELPDGGIRILSYSTNNYTFIGNEGEVLTVTVNVDSDVDNGDYTVMLRNIEMTQPDETYYITELTTATVSVYTEIPGDINGDRYHTIADVQAIVNLILTGVKAVDYPKADVNGDNRISITDLQAIVNLVLYQKSYAATHGTAKRAKRNYESENSLYIEPFSISAGEEKQVLIKLDNPSDAFSALQFDLYLPEGIDVATDNSSLALGSRTDDFNHNHPMSAYQEDGALRVICYSNSSSEFSNTSGDVITITLTAAPDLVDGSYDIEIRNVELARRDATADRPADTTTRVSVDSWTGISDMADDGAEVEVYDVYGRKVTKAEKRGIYIVNGKKVFNK